jgi:hypothetical protein
MNCYDVNKMNNFRNNSPNEVLTKITGKSDAKIKYLSGYNNFPDNNITFINNHLNRIYSRW